MTELSTTMWVRQCTLKFKAECTLCFKTVVKTQNVIAIKLTSKDEEMKIKLPICVCAGTTKLITVKDA